MPPPIDETHMDDMEGENHYQVLKVQPQASIDVIRSSYKSLSLSCHPDKIRRSNATDSPSAARRLAAQQAQAQRQWDRIEQAHTVLSDPLTRALYDLQIGLVSDSAESHARIARLKRKDAQRAVALMEETVAQSRAQEEAKGGLLIVSARYGDLSATEEEAARAVTPPYIDVAVPLQYLVADSALVFEAGRSRCWLEGFYDPTMGADTAINRLYVRYKFLGHMHEAEFDDEEAVAIPLEEHYIGEADESTGAAAASASGVGASAAGRSTRASAVPSTSSRATLVARQKARRRTMLYTGLAAAGLGLYFFGRPAGRAAVSNWTQWLKRLIAERVAAWANANANPNAAAVPRPAATAAPSATVAAPVATTSTVTTAAL